MVLVDTSVWIDHLRSPNLQLIKWLTNGEVLVHPFVIGELACGNLKDRKTFLSNLSALPQAVPASNSEVRHLIESRCHLHTFDARLKQIAPELRV